MEEYLQEKADIATHILQGEWETAHEKALTLLQKEPENIEFIVFATMSSAYGGFFQDAVDYGKKALSWAENYGNDIADLNSAGMSIIDIQELIAQAYFGLKNYSSAVDELDKIRQTLGQLPDSIKQFAVKNENMMNGVDAALHLAEQLDAEFDDRTSNEFYEFKIFEIQICFHEIIALADGFDFPENLQVAKAQKMAGYLLRLVNCFENVDESYLDEDSKTAFKFGKEWLWKAALILYKGDRANEKAEMEVNKNYFAARECIMALEKLSDLGLGYAHGLLGDIYSVGYNTAQDNVKAFNYYKLAYESGIDVNRGLVLSQLALYYDEGVVTEKDTQKALEYAKAAAETGDKRGYIALGQIYADSLGDVEQGLIWLKKAYDKGAEIAKDIILRLARENIEDFDEKLKFIFEINERVQGEDISLQDSPLEIGKKYARYYMEIEKYHIRSIERRSFLVFFANAQPEALLEYGGFVSVDYYMDQFEKCLQEEENPGQRIQWIRIIANRADKLFNWEMIQTAASGKDVSYLGWQNVCKYIYDKSAEWGWDGRMEDGKTWGYKAWCDDTSSQAPSQSVTQYNSKTMSSGSSYTSNTSNGSGGCYIATSVYGSYNCPEVWILRRFRDYSLAKSIYGQLFIRLYYTVSPILVKFFGNTVWFRQFWKRKLDKIVQELREKGYKDTPYCD